MKLYYAPGTCSLSPHIVAIEAGIALDLERVDIRRTPRITETGAYLFTIINWYGFAKVDLSAFPKVKDFMRRIGARPAVLEALRAEGLQESA